MKIAAPFTALLSVLSPVLAAAVPTSDETVGPLIPSNGLNVSHNSADSSVSLIPNEEVFLGGEGGGDWECHEWKRAPGDCRHD